MKKPLSINLPYPTVEGEISDKNSVSKLSFLYAGKHGELNAILQYTYHYFYFKRLNDEETAEIIIGIAFSEMHHLEILGEVLLQAGIEPIYAEYLPFGCNFYKSDVVSYSKTAGKMLLDDISGELVAIDSYEKAILSIANEEVKAVLTRIKLDEELHVKVLKERLEKYCEKEKIFNT